MIYKSLIFFPVTFFRVNCNTILTVFFILISFSLYSANLEPVTVTRHFGAEDGLSTKTIYSIVQDHDGYLWFGTDAGAFRYDGNEFKRYRVESGLSDNEILRLYVDKSGKVWFLTYNGYLSYYYKGKIFNQKNTPFLKSAYLGGSFISAEEDNGKIWFSTFKKGFLSIEDTVVNKIVLSPYELEMSYPFIARSGHDDFWFFSSYHIINLKTRDSIYIKDPPFAFCTVKGIGDVLYLSEAGVYRFHDGKTEPFVTGKSLPDFTQVAGIFYETDSDNLWISTLGQGCSLYHKGKFVQTYLSNSSVTSVARDSEGNIWFSTMNDGVYVYYKGSNSIRNYDKRSGLPDNKVFSLAIDESSNIWLGFYNGEVIRVSGCDRTTFKLSTWNNASFLRTMSILALNDTVWCGNDGGIYYITKEKVVKVLYPDTKAILNNYSVKHLTSDENNSIYGSFSFNLLKVDKSPDGYHSVNLFDSLIRVFSSVRSKDGRFYVSAISGLIEFVPGKYSKKLDADYDFSQVRIPDMKIDASGDLILATNVDGVFVLRNRRVVQHITTADQLSDNSCRKMFIKDSLLYICTQKGLNIFVKLNGRWVFKNEVKVQDGLLDNSTNDVAANDSLIFIATDGGLSVVNMDVFNAPHLSRKINISEIIFDKPAVIENGRVSFKSTVPQFIIKYSYPVFNYSNRVSFRYRLRKSDGSGEWVNTVNNQIQFSSLDPGTYIFEIKPYAREHASIISSVEIEVLPMWWQTLLARLFFGLLLLAMISFLIKQWTKLQYERRIRLLKQNQLIERERNRIASDMHDDIGADLTQISIWSNVLKGNSSDSKVLVDRISKLSNEVLSKMDQIIWALNSVQNQSTDLIAYIYSYTQEYSENNNITLEFVIGKHIPGRPLSLFQRRNVFLVVKELLHNTVKHSNATRVEIFITYEGEFLIIDYKDNGKGFDGLEKGMGIGLHTMMKRMEEINSKLEINPGVANGMNAILRINLSRQTNKL